jgi:RNA recognition motif-containing protein
LYEDNWTKIFVGEFPLEITELDLVKHVSPFGNVATIKIVRDKKSNICKGYAFLEIESRKDAQEIIEALHGTIMEGRELKISIVEPEAPTVMPPPAVKRTIANNLATASAVKPKRPRIKSPV